MNIAYIQSEIFRFSSYTRWEDKVKNSLSWKSYSLCFFHFLFHTFMFNILKDTRETHNLKLSIYLKIVWITFAKYVSNDIFKRLEIFYFHKS